MSGAHADQVRQILESTDLSREQVGRLFGVSGRAVHHWLQGGSAADRHQERAVELLGVISGLLASTPAGRRAVLLDSAGDRSLFHQLLPASPAHRLVVPGVPVRDRLLP